VAVSESATVNNNIKSVGAATSSTVLIDFSVFYLLRSNQTFIYASRSACCDPSGVAIQPWSGQVVLPLKHCSAPECMV